MKDYQEQIIEKAKEFFSQHQDVLFAYLYGSMNESSDLDIAVYLKVDDISKIAKRELDLHGLLEDYFEKEVDLLILNTAPIELAYSAHKGELVGENNKKERIEFEVNIRKKYWDFVPILRIYLNHSMEKLKILKEEIKNAPWSK